MSVLAFDLLQFDLISSDAGGVCVADRKNSIRFAHKRVR